MTRLLDRLFRREEINGGERCPTYLYRWTLFYPRRPRWLWAGFGVYLHHFVADDWSRDLHDHPKRFISIGLRGGYVETVGVGSDLRGYQRVYRAPWVRTFPAEHIHRLSLIDGRPCWTLVIVLRAKREWGFWHFGKFIPWRTYVNSDTATQMKSCAD